MNKKQIVLPGQKELKPSPTAKLTDKEGNFVAGTLRKRFDSQLYPGQKTYLIQVDEMDADTVIFDKEKQINRNVDVVQGDTVFVKGTTLLNRYMEQIADGSKVEIRYDGKGKARPGRKAAHLFTVSLLGE